MTKSAVGPIAALLGRKSKSADTHSRWTTFNITTSKDTSRTFRANASRFKGLMQIDKKVPIETDPHQLDVVALVRRRIVTRQRSQ
jgi:hypothetical protein